MIKYNKFFIMLIDAIRRRSYMKKGEISAVHDDDLVDLIKSLGLYEQIINGDIKCAFCEKTINLENIQGVFPHDNQINFSCNDVSCYEKLLI